MTDQPKDQPAADPAGRADEPRLDVLLQQKASERRQYNLVHVRTLAWMSWAIVVFAIVLFGAVEAARIQSGIVGLGIEVRGSLVILLIIGALAWHKAGAPSAHAAKFVFTNPEDVVRFVHFNEVGLAYGVPKLYQTEWAWVYFTNYRFSGHSLKLVGGGHTITINLSRATGTEQAEIRAGLARVFARPRIGPPIHIRHCMGCGYDLTGSSGPDCPECGRPFHKLNYPGARTSDL